MPSKTNDKKILEEQNQKHYVKVDIPFDSPLPEAKNDDQTTDILKDVLDHPVLDHLVLDHPVLDHPVLDHPVSDVQTSEFDVSIYFLS